jgi:erythronate-4-phosphate dehydrogenase
MLDEKQLEKLRPGAVLINAGRGEVVDNKALLGVYNTNPNLITALDVWEHEPAIHQDVLARVDIATPHIAGYSFDGKIRATQMLKNSFCDFFAIDNIAEEKLVVSGLEIDIDTSGESRDVVCAAILSAYPISKDDEGLRQAQVMSDVELATHFDALRKKLLAAQRIFTVYGISISRLS